MTNQINSLNFTKAFNQSIESFLKLLVKATKLPMASVLAYKEEEIIFQKTVGVEHQLFKKVDDIKLQSDRYFISRLSEVKPDLKGRILEMNPKIEFIEGVLGRKDDVSYCLLLFTTSNKSYKEELTLAENQLNHLFLSQFLQNQSERLENIINSTEVGTWEWNVQSGEVKINDRYAEMLGYKKEELEPTTLATWHSIVHPEDSSISDELTQECFDKKREFYNIECRLIHKDGSIVWVNDRGKVISWTEDGKPLIMAGTHTDITERKLQEERGKNIINNVPGVVFRYQRFKDGSDRMLLVSEKSKELWGYTADEVMNNNQLAWNNYHQEDLAKHIESIEQSAKNLSYWVDEWRYYHPELKEYRWHRGFGNPIKQEDGSFIWDSIIRDVTDEIRTKNELKESVWELKERIKEQECLTEISRLCGEVKDQERLLSEAAKVIPEGFQYPDFALTEIIFKGKKYKSNQKKYFAHSFSVKKKKITGNTIKIECGYTYDEHQVFLEEERELLQRVADMLILALERIALAEEERKSNERYESLVNTVDGVVWEANAETFQFIYVSPQVEKLLGYTSEEWLAEKDFWQNHIYEPDREAAINFCHGETIDSVNHSFDYRMYRKDGSLVWIHDIVSVVEEQGKGKLLRGIMVDISESKAVENRLKSLYKDNYLILQSTEEGIYGIDNEGCCTFINPAAAEMIGYEVNECIGKNMHELIHYKSIDDKKIEEVDCPIYQAKKELRPCRVEEDVFWRKEGSPFYVRYSSTPIIDEGEVNGAVVVFNDISEQKKTKDELAKNRRRYEALVENGGDAVAILGADGSTKFVSPSIQNVLGYSVEEALKLRLVDIVHDDDFHRIGKVVETAINNPGIPQPPDIARVQHKNGHFIYAEAIITSMLHDPAVEGIVDNFRDVTPRVLAEQKIKESQKRFKALVQDGSDLIAILNADRSFQYVSPNYNIYTEVKDEDLIGKNAIDFIHPEDRDWVHEEFNRLNDEERIKTPPFRFKYKDGWRWIQSTAINLIEDKDVKGIVVNSADVTEMMETQKELKESEARYRGFYDSQTNYVIRTDMEGNYSYVNKKFLEDFAWVYPEGDLIGKSCMPSIAEYHHPRVIEVVEACIHNPEKVFKVEIDKPKKDGSIVTTLWDFVCVLDAAGNPLEIQCMGIDISERIQFEKELKNNIARFEHVNELTNDAIYDWNILVDYFYWGKSFSRIFGHEMSVIGTTLEKWKKLIHPEDIKAVDESLSRFLNNPKQKQWDIEYRFLKADETYAWVLEKGQAERDQNGAPFRMVGILRDITERKIESIRNSMEQQLAAYFRQKNTLKQTLDKSLKYLSIFGKFEGAELWLVGTEKNQLNLAANVGVSKESKAFIKSTKNVKSFKKGEGIPGTVWQSGKLQQWDNIGENERFIRRVEAKKKHFKSAIGIPLYHNQELIGSLVFFGNKPSNDYLDKVKPFSHLKDFLGAEIKRKLQEEELSLLFESSPDIMAIASPNNHFVKANPAFCQLLGYTEEELCEKDFNEFLHPEDLAKTMSEYVETVGGDRNARNFVNRYRTKNGAYKWISWSSSNPFGDEGFVFSYGRDVTEMRELEELLETATSLSRLGFWEIDLITNEVYFSKVVREIHEVDDDFQPTVENSLAFYREDYRDYVTVKVESAIKKGDEFEYEVPLITAKGNEVWIKGIGKVDVKEGEVQKVYGSFQDITHRKLQENEINYQNELLSALTQIIGKLLSEDDWYEVLDEVFDFAGRSVEVDRVYYFQNHKSEEGELLASQRFEWAKENIKPEINNPNLQNMSLNIFEDFMSELHEVGYFQAVVSKMKDSPFKRELESEDILAVLIIPLFIDGEFYGFIGFDDCTLEREWNPAEVNFLRSLASNLSNAIKRRVYKENLEKSYEERNQILESIGDAFFSVNKDWVVTYWNQKAEEVLSTPKSKILDKVLWEIFDDAVELKYYSAYYKAMKNQEIVHFEEYYPPVEKWFEVSAYPSKEGISVYFRDVTQRKKIEEEIRESNERFEKVAEATSDAIWDFDALTNISYWGKGFETLFGIQSGEIKNGFDYLVSLMHEEDAQRINESYRAFVNDKKATKWYAEYRIKKSDGNYAYIIDRGTYIRNKDGDVVRGIGAMTDITYRKEYEDSLQELNTELKERARELAISNADLEQFAFVASHDLQEPLRMVSSFLTQLEKRYGDQLDERAHKYIDFAVDGAMRMKQIILDILEYSRVGKHNDRKEEIDLNDVVEDVKKVLKQSIEERKVKIQFKNLPIVSTFQGPLTQVMQNLINNAIKYSKADVNPLIKITAKERKEDWEIAVADNGIGIDSDYFEKIFMIFQRLHKKGQYEGSGMGLAIVKKNIDKLGGEIWVKSKVGEGSTFFFTIKK